MRKIWENTKARKCMIILGLILAAVFAFFYLRFIFQTGIWYSNIFWQRSRDVDSGWHATVNGDDIELIRRVVDHEIEVTYRCNGEDEVYRVHKDKKTHSTVVTYGGEVVYDEPEMGVMVYVENADMETRKTAKLRLVAFIGLHPEDGMRGNPVWLFGVVIALVILAIDLRWPDFFFYMRHFLTVRDPEPTDFYRFGQNLGRCGLVIMIIVWLMMGAAQG